MEDPVLPVHHIRPDKNEMLHPGTSFLFLRISRYATGIPDNIYFVL
jgi:hypothetical protein